ncbi:hypothetical protein QC761_601700 [Podospora bellae-mahoneyi]|uniref:SAP domain-containing protein n=1 Tax=Podospora bellae-mahoneyi TaxID=2093777 RepID=A0ABR0FC07_9PEZI|nr:hypothetical protein QC761_601700 [Podospora bellae-mahoneyi]
MTRCRGEQLPKFPPSKPNADPQKWPVRPFHFTLAIPVPVFASGDFLMLCNFLSGSTERYANTCNTRLVANAHPTPTMATEFEKMTVTQLRAELKRRKLATTGLKAALVARLVDDEEVQTAAADQTAQDESPADEPEPVQDANPEAGTEKQDDVAMDDAPVAASEKATSPAPASPSPAVKNEETVTTQPDSAIEPEITTQQDSNPPPEEPVEVEPVTITEIVQDTVSRKRRSRSPPPSGDESFSKRARQDDWEEKAELEESRKEPASPADKHLGEITPFEVVPPRSPETRLHDESPPHKRHERAWGQRLEGNQPRYQEQNMDIDEPMDEFGRVERSRHPATSALYVKNFMRPLREASVREYFVHLAAFPGAPVDDSCIIDFHVDQMRTHALVKFDSVSAASRVRTALHGKVWPNESTRKELWVDFIPPEKVAEWIDLERQHGRQTRWEVIFEDDPDTQEVVVASLVQCDGASSGNNNSGNRPARQPLPPPVVPTGPGRRFAELQGQGYPAGPRVRGRGQAKHDLENFENTKRTSTGPPLYYQPVSEELAQRRLDNMQSYYTKDRYRDMGREDEINRYTFESGSQFVDRGKEVFVGIRHPIREARKRRERNELRRGRGRRTPSPPPFRRQDDRAYRVRDDRTGGGNWSRDRFEALDREDDRIGDGDAGPKIHPDRRLSMERTDRNDDRRWERGDDVPRSRFDGAPLPTYTGPPRNHRRRGGGGGRNRR